MMLRRLFLTAALLGFSTAQSQALVYYINPTGTDSGANASGTPWKTLTYSRSHGATCGDTVVYQNGNYNYAGIEINQANIPACTSWSSSSFTVRGETFGSVFINQSSGLDLQGSVPTETTYYVRIDNLIWTGATGGKNLSGHFVYIKNFGMEGGCSSGNCTNFEFGNNNFGSKASATDMLLEDGYFVGPSTGSGRYQSMMYDTERVLQRQVVGHIENGWTDGGSTNPSGIWTFYNAHNTGLLNAFAIDNVRVPSTYQAPYYFVNNTGQPQTGDQVYVEGSLGLNNTAGWGCLYFDNGLAYSSATFKDFGCIDSPRAFALGYAGAVGMTMDGFTVRQASAAAGQDAFTYGSAGTKVIKNGIMSGMASGGTGGSASIFTYTDWFNSGTAPGTTGQKTYDPLLNGASYYTRTETGSNLTNDGNGKAMGAQIVFRLGADGKFFGDAGWDTPTATHVFPIPNEVVIKQRLCTAYSDGLCSTTTYASTTLSSYINGRGANPYLSVDSSSPTTPGTPSTTTVSASAIGWTWSAATDDTAVSGYKYDLATDSGFSSLVTNNQDNGNATTLTTSGLSASTAYYIRVRAYDAVGNTSSSSSTGTGTTSAAAAPTVSGNENMRGTGSISGSGGIHR